MAHATSSSFVASEHTTNGAPLKQQFDSIPDCIEAFAAGNFLIVLDSPDRENEGDLIIAAHAITTAKAAFMIRYTSGYLCAPISAARCATLGLPPLVAPALSQDPKGTAYTVTVDADVLGDKSTGISAHDRALTCRMLGDEGASPQSFRRPGHVLPLRVRDGGVRVRRGHTEAAWEFCRLAGVAPAASVIGELVVDGEVSAAGLPELEGSGMMRARECLEFGRRWAIKTCTIADLVEFVERKEGVLPEEGLANGHAA